MEIISIYNKFRECGVVATDFGALRGGEMFFALKGENFDGNEYALKALEAGAAYAVVNKDSAVASVEDPRLVKVDDTLKTLQDLARWHRSMTIVDGKPLTVVALAGTERKTVLKELIRKVLSFRYDVVVSDNCQNDATGVPMTLLRITKDTKLAVVEMRASSPGGIKELVDIALPNYGLIADIDASHLCGFDNLEDLMNTTGELYDYLRRTSDKVFINVDNPYLCRMAADRNLQSDPERPYSLLIPYGLDYQGARIMNADAEHAFLRIELEGRVIGTNLSGTYDADCVMAALAVGRQFGISLDEACDAIGSL